MEIIKPTVQAAIYKMTKAFEGGGLSKLDGLSWGPLQWNLKSGTLQPLLRRICELDPYGTADLMGWSFVQAAATPEGVQKYVTEQVLPDWQNKRRLFDRLERREAAVKAFTEGGKPYWKAAVAICDAYTWQTPRGLALAFDTAVQNGPSVRSDHWRRFRELLDTRYAVLMEDNVLEEWEEMKVFAHAVAQCATPKWHDDVLSRKLCIALRKGKVHGKEYDIRRDFGITYYADREKKILDSWAS